MVGGVTVGPIADDAIEFFVRFDVTGEVVLGCEAAYGLASSCEEPMLTLSTSMIRTNVTWA